MKTWLIEPRDPLIFRDGRPFDASAGARAKSLPFPFPSTLVGVARTVAGRDKNGHFDAGQIDVLLAQGMEGPLLVELSETGGIADWLFPAPADALVLRQTSYKKNAGHLVPLTVLKAPVGATSNLGDGLMLVGPVTLEKQKPHGKAPAFWRQSKFEDWLMEPKAKDEVMFHELGVAGLVRESRMHVSIGHDSQTAEKGALFQTAGLEFMSVDKDDDSDNPPQLGTVAPLALTVRTSVGVTAGLSFLGGERRIVRWSALADDFPACPDDVRERIKEEKHCRLILLTPGLFAEGYLPAGGRFDFGGVKAIVVAAAVNRYQTVSGWDYAYVAPNGRRGRPKPTRRLAPAGSVYFLKLDGDENAVDRFIDAVWMHNISDKPQDRRDGFGLAALGVWDGMPRNMEVTDES